MSQEAVERVLGRLITDERFRCSASSSLGSACLQEGYSLSMVELELLSGFEMKQISDIASQISPGLCSADTGVSIPHQRWGLSKS